MSILKNKADAQHVLEHATEVLKEIEHKLDEGDINSREEFDLLCNSAARCAIIKAAVTSMEVMK